MKSVMTSQQYFNQVQQPQINRSKFNRSHGYKTTFNSGLLIPIYADEAIPGDTFNVKANLFGRLSTPLHPFMDNVFIDLHFFSVPNRLLWDNWKKMMGEQKNPGDSTNFIVPTITAPVGGFTEASIYDYFGVPTKVAGLEINALYNRAYNMVYNEWYRDENLQTSLYCPTDDGPDDPAQYLVNYRGKRKDYFTSALPFAQKHSPVTLPLGGQASLVGNLAITRETNANAVKVYAAASNTLQISKTPMDTNLNGFLSVPGSTVSLDPNGSLRALLDTPGMYADLSTATAITINALREAATVQQIYELDARGTRYTELLRAHFGVISPDARQQRPEFLGGATATINVNPIAQTSESGTSPQGNLAAMAQFSMHNKGFVKSFTEHETIIGIASVRADLNYQQGLDRKWSRSTRFDYAWPTFSHLGEQSILNKEIYAQGTAADELVFGYQERYADYRYKNSIITGLFRSNAVASLDVWHLAQDFSALPALNGLFIREQPPINRVVAVTTEPQFILDSFFDEVTARPLPTFSTPGIQKL